MRFASDGRLDGPIGRDPRTDQFGLKHGAWLETTVEGDQEPRSPVSRSVNRVRLMIGYHDRWLVSRQGLKGQIDWGMPCLLQVRELRRTVLGQLADASGGCEPKKVEYFGKLARSKTLEITDAMAEQLAAMAVPKRGRFAEAG